MTGSRLTTLLIVSLAGSAAPDAGSRAIAVLQKTGFDLVLAEVGEGWKLDNLVAIPDVTRTDALDERTRKVASVLIPSMRAMNAVAAYEISASRTRDADLDNVSVRVLVFDSREAAATLARSKFERSEEPFEKEIGTDGTITYTGKKHGKVVKIYRNLYIAAFRLQDPASNKPLAQAFLDAIRSYAE